jgi:hypothetical protein
MFVYQLAGSTATCSDNNPIEQRPKLGFPAPTPPLHHSFTGANRRLLSDCRRQIHCAGFQLSPSTTPSGPCDRPLHPTLHRANSSIEYHLASLGVMVKVMAQQPRAGWGGSDDPGTLAKYLGPKHSALQEAHHPPRNKSLSFIHQPSLLLLLLLLLLSNQCMHLDLALPLATLAGPL